MQKDEAEIAAALKANTEHKKLRYLDRGGTGIIYVSETGKDEKQIVKVLRPDIANADTAQAFREESEQLIALSTPNIIRGISIGQVPYGKTTLPFLVMEYFRHKNLDKQKKRIWNQGWDFVLGIFNQILKALAALHERGVCHLDIKERNILLDLESGVAKVLDLGSAKSTSELSGKTMVTGTFPYWPKIWQSKLKSSRYQIARTSIVLPRAEIDTDVDMHMLSVTISNVINSAPASFRDTPVFRRVELFAERMNWDDRNSTTNEERYLNAKEALNDWYKVIRPRSVPTLIRPEGMIRLPILSVTHFNKHIREVINLPWFLRLKNVLQLATAHLVYPSAKHDRYEHSLGVYENSLRYLEALFGNNNSVWPSIFLDAEECIYLALAALLHDLGHYPFAHQVEELEQAPSPDLISYILLAGEECSGPAAKYREVLVSEQLRQRYGDPATIRKTIEQFSD